MSYILKNEIEVLPGEVAVELDTGELVAVSCEIRRCLASHCSVYAPRARYIDGDGQTQQDAQGNDIVTTMRHSLSDDELSRLGAAAATRECMLVVLGEVSEPPLIPFSDGFRADCNIRRAIATAATTGPVMNVADLL